MQEERDFGGVFLAHGGDGGLEFSSQIERQMAHGAEGMGRVADAQPAVVFGELRVEHMEAALDEPAAAQVPEQERGVGLFPGEARDRVRRGLANSAFVNGVPFEADELLGARPVEIPRLDQVRGRRDGACLQSAPVLLPG